MKNPWTVGTWANRCPAVGPTAGWTVGPLGWANRGTPLNPYLAKVYKRLEHIKNIYIYPLYSIFPILHFSLPALPSLTFLESKKGIYIRAGWAERQPSFLDHSAQTR